MTLNVQRVFTLTQKLLPMLKQGAGEKGVSRVINVSAPDVDDPYLDLGGRPKGAIALPGAW